MTTTPPRGPSIPVAGGDARTPATTDVVPISTFRLFDFSTFRTTFAAGDATAPTVDASALPADLIHDDEVIILLLRPHILYVALSSLVSLVSIAVVTFALAYMAQSLSWARWNDTHAFGLGVGVAALRLGWQTLDWYSRLYVLTDRRLIRRMGVLRVAVFQTQLKNIQHVSVFRRVRERLFGLGTIGFATAGSDVFDALWVMVQDPFAVHKIVNEAIERYS